MKQAHEAYDAILFLDSSTYSLQLSVQGGHQGIGPLYHTLCIIRYTNVGVWKKVDTMLVGM